MGSYVDSLKSASPDLYNKLANLAKYTADQNFGGQVQDYQAEIFAGLDPATLAKAPKKIDFDAATMADPNNRIIGNSEDNWAQVIGYKKPIITSSGTQVFAEYDNQGNLTGYSGNPMQRSFLSGNQSVSGRWDASGKPNPQQYSSSGGGFAGNFVSDLGDIATDLAPLALKAAALYYGGSAIGDALAPAVGTTGTSALGTAGPSLPIGSEYVAPQVTTLGTVAGPTEGMLSGTELGNAAQGLQMPQSANLANMGGGQGLGGATSLTNLAEMGGAQGLTTAAAGLGAGSMLGAGGAGAALTPAAAGLGAGLGTSLAGIDTGAAAAGLGAAATNAAAAGAGGAAANTLTGSALGDIAAIGGATGLATGYLQSNAAKEAAQIQADAAAKAIAQQQKNFETINAQQAPYRAAGYGALNKIANIGGGGVNQYDANGNVIGTTQAPSDYLTHQFNAADLAAGLAPNYDFMLKQGQAANQRAANVGGGVLGGNALQGLNKYTQDYAGNAYQNAFNNYQTQRNNIYNTLAGIAGIGQTGQNATNTAATNATNAATQLGVGSAAAQAAGQTGSANAYTNAINQGVNNYTLASLLNQRGNVQLPVQG